jgi:hypothetical protein
MTTQEIAARLTALCKEGKYEQAQKELYADDAKSIEPVHSQGLQTVEGLENIIKKGDLFQSMVEEMHGGYVSDAVVGGNYISLAMGMDVTMKGMGRTQMDEIVVYKVKDGKIVQEEFFY